ncbi:MAG: hypothetical protein AB1445_00010 [Bacillota bacterium]
MTACVLAVWLYNSSNSVQVNRLVRPFRDDRAVFVDAIAHTGLEFDFTWRVGQAGPEFPGMVELDGQMIVTNTSNKAATNLRIAVWLSPEMQELTGQWMPTPTARPLDLAAHGERGYRAHFLWPGDRNRVPAPGKLDVGEDQLFWQVLSTPARVRIRWNRREFHVLVYPRVIADP